MRLGSLIGAITGPLLSMPLATGAPNLSGLIDHNPFGKAEKPVEELPEPARQLELRGVIRESDGYLLNVFDLETKKSTWVREGDRTAGYLIRNYDLKGETAFLESAGKTLALNLKSSRSQGPDPVGSGPPSPMPQVARLQVKAAPLSVPPAPAGEVQRLDQVAQQIKLRREQRQKTANGGFKT